MRNGRVVKERRRLERLAGQARFARAACFHGVWQLSGRMLRKKTPKADEKYLGPADADAWIVVKGQRTPAATGSSRSCSRDRGTRRTRRPSCLCEKERERHGRRARLRYGRRRLYVGGQLEGREGVGCGEGLLQRLQGGQADARRIGPGRFLAARDLRSPVEPLMYTLKWVYGFSRIPCTSLSYVRAEMLGKAVSYSRCFCANVRRGGRRRNERRPDASPK